MLLIIAGVMLAGWLLFSGWKFYHSIDWTEPADPSPDLRAMHQKEAELMHIQEVLEEAHREGQLSQQVLDEFNRYSTAKISAMQAVETAWKNRRKTPQAPD